MFKLNELFADRMNNVQNSFIREILKVTEDPKQQVINLTGKVFLNKGDNVLFENPTYLAAIQSFGLMEAKFKSLPLLEDGVDIEALRKELDKDDIKLFILLPISRTPPGNLLPEEKESSG